MSYFHIAGHPSETKTGSIYCIGRNYAEHAAELDNPVPSQPLVFLKPASSILHSGGEIILPSSSESVHHEVEVVVSIGKTLKEVSSQEALNGIGGYGIGIDMTARDIQQKAKDKGHPWTVAKGFDTFAPISEFVPSESVDDPQLISLSLSVNGEFRQKGNTRNMIFPIAYLVEYLSKIFTLYPGDLIFTGTPSGVGPVNHGDKIYAELGEQLVILEASVVKP